MEDYISFNILICYHSATRQETSETNLKNMPTLELKKFHSFSLHPFDSLNMNICL